jgi:hypothetical protein
MKTVETALYSLLTGNAALTSLLSSATAIYNRRVPQSATLPYVVFFHSGGGPENRYPGDLESVSYMIKGVAATVSAAATIDDAIKAAVHGAEGSLSVTGCSTLWLRRTNEVQMVEDGDEGEEIWHYGAYYRLRIDA